MASTSTQVLVMISLELTPKSQGNKSKTKPEYIKLKSICIAKETINKMKRKPAEWVNIFENHRSDKEFIFKIYKELLQFNSKNANNLNFKWEKDLRRYFFLFFQRSHTGSQHIHEKVFNITNHQGNINTNHCEKLC